MLTNRTLFLPTKPLFQSCQTPCSFPLCTEKATNPHRSDTLLVELMSTRQYSLVPQSPHLVLQPSFPSNVRLTRCFLHVRIHFDKSDTYSQVDQLLSPPHATQDSLELFGSRRRRSKLVQRQPRNNLLRHSDLHFPHLLLEIQQCLIIVSCRPIVDRLCLFLSVLAPSFLLSLSLSLTCKGKPIGIIM